MDTNEIYGVYLSIYSIADMCLAPTETIVTLFTIKYCKSSINIKLIPIKQDPGVQAYKIDLSSFAYEIVTKIPSYANLYELPCVIVNEFTCMSGLCVVLRHIIQCVISIPEMDIYSKLLGYRSGSLKVSSETCEWTKFCEIDLISTLKNLDTNNSILPTSLARFECHMSAPIKAHHAKHKYSLCKKLNKKIDIVEQEDEVDSNKHDYVEALHVTLADIIIFVCMHMLLNTFSSETIPKLVPLTIEWYDRMLADERIKECISCLPSQESDNINIEKSKFPYIFPVVVKKSLYTRTSKTKCYTDQLDIERSIQLVLKIQVPIELDAEPFGAEKDDLIWTCIPYDAKPEGGNVPKVRCKRKEEQLQNLCKAVLKLAKDGDTIVDFCSGSGHLGILVAYLLPKCEIILMENKDIAINFAKKRIEKLKLKNVRLCHGNFNYFKLKFDIGMMLHGCGVATDLVIQYSIDNNAIFVCCPCCYGCIQDCFRLTYPRSNIFNEYLKNHDYLFLSHAGDQTHLTDSNAHRQNVKNVQGFLCMTIVDIDRKLYAEQFEYKVHLGRLIPSTCTVKNNLLVGIPKHRMTCDDHKTEK